MVVSHARRANEQKAVPALYAKDREARELSVALFQRLDTDGNGLLSQGELLEARSIMLCQEDAGQEAIRNFTSLGTDFDVNHDGSIDREEWHEFVGSLYELMGRRQFLLITRNWVANAPPAAGAAPVPLASSAVSRKAGSAGAKPGADARHRASTADESMSRAATSIQSAARGKHARPQVNAERQPTRHSTRRAANLGSDSTEQKLTSLEDLWDLLTTLDGVVRTSVDIQEVVRLFELCKVNGGMGPQLAASVPMHFQDCAEPEDISPGETAHLCLMLLDNPSLTVHEARVALEPIKASCRNDAENGLGHCAVDTDSALNWRRFKQLIAMLGSLMRLDEQYLVSQMQFIHTGRFELPETMAAILMERSRLNRGAAGIPTVTADDVWASLATGMEVTLQGLPNSKEVLAHKFTLDDFVRFCYNVGIVDASGKAGITYTDMSMLFTRTVSKLPELLKAHATKATKTPAALAKGRDTYITGRTEFEILLYELSKEPAMEQLHRSPFSMVLSLLQRSGSAQGGD
mmetsp:Transcript_39229/g.90987  ORF Transcript_39229/g.90987 Transcript_39229/m.90987 type:complete len:520 (-) Transcript_39229:105-1664(-)